MKVKSFTSSCAEKPYIRINEGWVSPGARLLDCEVPGMKRILVLLISMLLFVPFIGCSKDVAVKKTFNEGIKTYYEMSDGTWKCDDHSYKYRLEIRGRMPNAAKDSYFVYLSNTEEISFEQAYMAAYLQCRE